MSSETLYNPFLVQTQRYFLSCVISVQYVEGHMLKNKILAYALSGLMDVFSSIEHMGLDQYITVFSFNKVTAATGLIYYLTHL